MKRILLLLLVMTTSLTYCQEAMDIRLKSGKELSGYGKIRPKGVKFKQQKKGKYKMLKAATIALVTVKGEQSKNDEDYSYRVLKKNRKPQLVKVFYEGEHIDLLVLHIEYTKIDSYGNSIPRSYETWYAQRKDEDVATIISTPGQVSLLKGYKKRTTTFFSDCPDLVRKIETKEFDGSEIFEMVMYYDTHCGQH